MADISKEIKDFKQAIYGEEVRGSMVSMAEKLNNEVSKADQHAGSLEELNEQAEKNIKDLEKLKEDAADGLGRLGSVEKSITELDGKITTAESSIQQNANELALKASKSEVDSSLANTLQSAKDYSDAKYSDNISYTDTKFQVASDEISSKVSGVEKSLKNITVGGTNLIRGSRDFIIDPLGVSGFKEPPAWGKSVDGDFTVATLMASGLTNNRYTSLYSNHFPLTEGQPMIVSVWVKVTDLSQWDGRSVFMFESFGDDKENRLDFIEVGFANDHGNNPTVTDNKWVKFIWERPEITGTYGRVRLMLQRNGEISFKKLKVEYGSVASDWSPAPEDISEDLNNLEGRLVSTETSIIQNRDQIALRATKTELSNTLNEAKDYADAQLTAANIYSDAQLQVKSDQISADVIQISETVDNLTIGGRNLSKKADLGKRYSGGNLLAGGGAISVNGYELSVVSNPVDLPGFTAEVPTGKNTLVVSGYSDLQDVVGYRTFRKSSDNSEAIAQTTQWTATNDQGYFEFIIDYDNPDADIFNIGLGDYPYANPYKIWNVKIEVGNLATAWTPAPEDISEDVSNVNNRLTVAETNITQNATDISQRATKTEVTNAVKDAKDYTDNKIGPLTANLNKAQTDLNKAVSDLNAVKSDLTSTQADLDAAQNKVDKTTADLTKATNDLAALGTRVSTAETNIQQNASAISLKASKSDLDTFKNSTNSSINTLTTQQSQLTVKANAIESSVNSLTTTTNGMNTRLSTAETNIQQNASAISLKASQSDLDTFKNSTNSSINTLTTQQSQLTVKANAIESSVNNLTTTTNGMNTRLSTAETKINQNATDISLRATKTELDNATKEANEYTDSQIINNKGYTLTIEQKYQSENVICTANVFSNGKQLTDFQIYALGALNWYKDGTKISTGKSITRSIGDVENISCKLETGGG